MKNIKKDISNIALRKAANKIYYFDKNGVYQSVSFLEAKKMKLHMGINKYGEPFILPTIYYYNSYFKQNYRLCKKAVTLLKEGDTLETLDDYLSKVIVETHQKPEGIDRFILNIEKPVFVRTPENPNKKTFDCIRITVYIVTEWSQDRMQFIQEHIKEFNKLVLNKLELNKEFQKFNVPINFLKISNITFSARSNLLEYIFELKDFS